VNGQAVERETPSGERVLQRVVLPLDADHDILPLYIESAVNQGADEVRTGALAGAQSGGQSDAGDSAPPADNAVGGSQGAPVSASSTVTGRHSLSVRDGDILSLGSYFNAFPAGYWQRWSTITAVRLRLRLVGAGAVIVQRTTSKGYVMRVESRQVRCTEPETVEFDLPLKTFIDGGWYWFDLAADGARLQLLSGEWVADTDRTTQGTVTIGITTFNRPTFCVDQLESLGNQPEVLAILDEILIVDQGTQKVVDDPRYAGAAERLGGRVRVVDQPNLGGSGGFSRAMDETVIKGDSTYCLLLDDDVVSEPEGILRVVTFADLARTSTIVGGQMLSLYSRCVLHAYGEAVAQYRWFWGPAPGTFHGMDFGRQSLRSTPWLHRRVDVDYNGWWMCLIPADVIRKVGLSVPMFIKWDDAEYGMRARDAGFPTVTLPGVAVWHVPWHEKDDTVDWQAYFHRRNRIVAALLHSPYDHGGRLIVESFDMQIKYLLAMQYSAAELGLMAIEDVLEGPGRLHRDVARRIPELRALRKGYPDAQMANDLEDFPPPRRPKPPRKGKTPTAPETPLGLMRNVALGALSQLKPVRETSRRNPEIALPHLYQHWWRLARVDSALVSSADGSSAAWYQRDNEQFRNLLARSVTLHLRLWRQWSALTETYRTALPEVSSAESWRHTIEHFAELDGSETGSTETGSTETGSTETGSTETGSTGTGSIGTGSAT